MKEYLKMADVFGDVVAQKIIGDAHEIMSHIYGHICVVNTKERADIIANAINSHDELVAEVERLRVIVSRMQTYLDMAGEYPEKESDNPVRRWLFDAIDCTK